MINPQPYSLEELKVYRGRFATLSPSARQLVGRIARWLATVDQRDRRLEEAEEIIQELWDHSGAWTPRAHSLAATYREKYSKER